MVIMSLSTESVVLMMAEHFCLSTDADLPRLGPVALFTLRTVGITDNVTWQASSFWKAVRCSAQFEKRDLARLCAFDQ